MMFQLQAIVQTPTKAKKIRIETMKLNQLIKHLSDWDMSKKIHKIRV